MPDALPGNAICRLCHGRGALFCQQSGAREWHGCPGCSSTGVRFMFGPAAIVWRSSWRPKATPAARALEVAHG